MQVEDEKAAASLVSTVDAKDFPFSSFKVAINRIQQVALSKVNCKVPCPEDQLALLRTKQGKAERLNLSLIYPETILDLI